MALALTALVASLAGCAQLTGADADVADPTAGTTGSTDVLATQEWGELDGLVSVLVRNDGDRTLRRATAVVTAVDERGVTLASSAVQSARGDCCTVLDLPPGTTYGLYFDTQVDPAAIADVEVRYRDVSWANDETISSVTAESVGIRGSAEGTVVLADVTPAGTAVDVATVQATLARPDGTFLAVVSGRWHCFPADQVQRIEMELLHPVPAGTTVTGVQVLPIRPPNAATDYVDEATPVAEGCADGP